MRSLFIDQSIHDFSKVQAQVVLEDKAKLHHLNNVLRLKVKAEVLLFNQNGHYCLSELVEISRKSAEFRVLDQQQYKQPHRVELALCWLKKDALEDAITNAIQMGVSRIHLVKSEYSQAPSDLTKVRFQKLLISAMEQSNHFILPEIIEYHSIIDMMNKTPNCTKYGFTLRGEVSRPAVQIAVEQDCIYFIGPEGGLSENEIKELEARNMKFFHLPMPIMRAPVAVSCALGYIVAQIK